MPTNSVIDLIRKSGGADSSEKFLATIKRQVEDNQALLSLPDVLGATPLHWAVHRGPYEVVRLLVELGADKKLQTRGGMTPYDLATARHAPPAIVNAVKE